MIKEIKLVKDQEPEIVITFKTNVSVKTDDEDIEISDIKKIVVNDIMLDIYCYNDIDEHIATIGFKTYYESRTIFAEGNEIKDEIYIIENGKISNELIKMLTGFNNMKDIAFYILEKEDYKYIEKVLKEHKNELNYDIDFAGWYIGESPVREYLFEEENTYLNPKELGEIIEEIIEDNLKLKR